MLRIVKIATAILSAAALASCGGGGGGGGGGSGGGGGGANRAPVFTSAATASVAENTSGAFYTATASDADGNALTFSISGGADAGDFSITSGGALSFASPPDFEAPTDSNSDNIYNVTLRVTDGTAAATLALTVTVTDASGALAVRRVGTGFDQPLFVTGRGDGTGRVFVVEKSGRIRILNPATGAVATTPFLNVASQISTSGERGLLGFTTAPDFATSGVFYVFLTNPSGTIEIRRHNSSGDAATGSGDIIMTIAHPGRDNHNGGWIDFGPDGFLYIATGDGGGSGDPDGNGQDPNALLGKILRIDVSSDAFPGDANRDYAIPTGNPFATSGGAPEIWLWGLRNPFRNAFDAATGNLWIADVGQGAIEEINLARPSDGGANYGWNRYEGTQAYPTGSTPTSTAGLTFPIAQYPHGSGALQGNSITGGYVYRGPIAALRGEYFFGDYINDRIWSFPITSVTPGSTLANTGFTDRTAQFTPNAGTIANIASFGEDDAGNLYIVDIGDGEVFQVTAAAD